MCRVLCLTTPHASPEEWAKECKVDMTDDVYLYMEENTYDSTSERHQQ